jgi:hypothetical protein
MSGKKKSQALKRTWLTKFLKPVYFSLNLREAKNS